MIYAFAENKKDFDAVNVKVFFYSKNYLETNT